MDCCRQVLASLSSEKCLGEGEEEWEHFECPFEVSSTEDSTFGFAGLPSNAQIFPVANPPVISHEVNVVKSLLQRASSTTGDNLFDHLSDIIKRAVNDPHDNLVDYFEEYSHNLRGQKFRIKEPFKWVLHEPADVEVSKRMLAVRKFTYDDESDDVYDVCKEIKRERGAGGDGEDTKHCECYRKLAFNENVIRLQLYWSLCGFNISKDEALLLSIAIQKIHNLPIIKHARFWGKIYGLTKPYYIVEAKLTPEEVEERLKAMKLEMMDNINLFRECVPAEGKDKLRELIPGYSWRDSPTELLEKMNPKAAPVPKCKPILEFNVPPEPVGAGTNRLTYFVVNSLLDNWIELPIVTPKQVQVSRQIKHLFTGDLEAEVISFPEFPGVEKHFLRVMITRITAGTYIAPRNYYRKMTKFERMNEIGEEYIEEEAVEEEYDEDEDNDEDNDALIIENDLYEPDLHILSTPSGWVHFRPNILKQGRVRWFNVEKARAQLERQNRGTYEEDEMDGESEYDDTFGEVGPVLFSNCHGDKSTEKVKPWSPRCSSVHNKMIQLTLMRSSIWPGGYAFTTGKYSDCIYLGWGCKYTARNIQVPHLPIVQNEYEPDTFFEMTDPTPEMELAYEMWLKRMQARLEAAEEGDVEEETDSCENEE